MMRRAAMITLALLAMPAHADKASPFYQHCVESESIVASVQPQGMPMRVAAPQAQSSVCCQYGHRGQLSEEDISQIRSVQPDKAISPSRFNI
jgi:hypothetical protein